MPDPFDKTMIAVDATIARVELKQRQFNGTACPTAEHEAIKADDERWAKEVFNKRPWKLGADSLELGECTHCVTGTLARRVA